jgi:hypothetical protein
LKILFKTCVGKINQDIIKCFSLNLEDCPAINGINSELQELVFSLWDTEDKEGNSIIPIYKIVGESELKLITEYA